METIIYRYCHHCHIEHSKMLYKNNYAICCKCNHKFIGELYKPTINFCDLPNEILLNIIDHITDIQGLFMLLSSNKQFYSLICDKNIFTRILNNIYGYDEKYLKNISDVPTVLC